MVTFGVSVHPSLCPRSTVRLLVRSIDAAEYPPRRQQECAGCRLWSDYVRGLAEQGPDVYTRGKSEVDGTGAHRPTSEPVCPPDVCERLVLIRDGLLRGKQR